MSRPRKLITSAEAAKILGCTTQNIRDLAKRGLLSSVTTYTGRHSTTRYYENEVKARKAASSEIISLSKDTAELLEQAREENRQAELLAREARLNLRSAKDYPGRIQIISELLIGCLDAYSSEFQDVPFRYAVAKDILAGQTLDTVKVLYGVNSIGTIRGWMNKAVRSLRRAPDLVTRNQTLTAENIRLEKENASLKAYIDEHEELRSAGVSLDADGVKKRTILLTPLRTLGLSVRAYNCTHASGIETVADLVYLQRHELMKIRNLGRKTLSELDYLVEKLGLDFGFDIEAYGIQPSEEPHYQRLIAWRNQK